MIFESSGRRVARIALSGELDLSVKDRIVETLQPAKDADDVIVDLSQVPYIDSTALGCLVHVKNDLIQRGGGTVQLVGLRPNVRRVFALTKLDEIFQIIE
jgi:anti-sigma B factor antagonist